MQLGAFVVGEFKGINPDAGFGATLRVRVGEPNERNKDGYEERIEYFPFDPQSGERTLPAELKVGDFVVVGVLVKSKVYENKRGLGGAASMSLYTLRTLAVVDGKKEVQDALSEVA
ncbi:MAG TPA: hypothetical protein VGG21_03320 [Acidimicrobiales bacterium]